MEILDLPEELQAVFSQLELKQHQEFTETTMDSGHVKRRPNTPPFPTYQGTVILSATQKEVLDTFVRQTVITNFRLPMPNADTVIYGVFYKEPWTSKHSQTVGASNDVFEVDIFIKDTTDLVERCLAAS